MRSIGEIQDTEQATNFCGYLNGIDIHSEIEQEGPDGGPWTIWVHNEDNLDQAKSEFNLFRQNAEDPRYQKIAEEASQQKRIQDKIEAKQRAKNEKLAKRIQGRGGFPITYSLMGICLVTFLLQAAGGTETKRPFIEALFLYHNESIQSGQIWRLLTPIFLHFGLIHIAFNMLWLLDLGRILEVRFSSRFLLFFVAIAGIGSNICQAIMVPEIFFGGMSGVVYGLLGFIWMKARFAPESGLYLHPTTVTLMLVWLALGFSGTIGGMANGCHLGGLLIGTLWGYISAMALKRS